MQIDMVPTPKLITDWLDARGVAYRHVVHPPTQTSEESARARGEPLEIGAKALLIKAGDRFVICVMSAILKLDSAQARTCFGTKSIRFATSADLEALTGLVPGSVPPFGSPILPFELFVDTSIQALDRVAFNAASLTESLIMNASDYLGAANPTAISALAK